MKPRYLQLLFMFLSATLLSAQSGTRWQTTHVGTSSGECRLESNSFKIFVHPLHLDVEEEATIAAVGTVGWGDSSTLEITGTFQLSPGSAVRSMLLWNGSTLLKAKLRDRRSADSAYEDVVDRDKPIVVSRDPALIQYLGKNQYQFKIYPVAINQARKIRILYSIPRSPVSGAMAYVVQTAFTCGTREGAPTQIPYEFQIDSSDHRRYLLESNNKKRIIQAGNIYLLPYSDLVSQSYSWGVPAQLPIKVFCDSLKTSQAYRTTLDTGKGSGTYIALLAPVPADLHKAISSENVKGYTIEASISAGNKQYVVEVTDKAAVASYIKTEGEWNRQISWNAYSADGNRIFSMTDTMPVDSSPSAVAMLPLIWGAKYSLKEGAGNLGAVYGFVDWTVSLLALESDSVPRQLAEAWADGGVPPLDRDEIVVGALGVPPTPRENIIIEYPIGVVTALADNVRTCTFTVLPNGLVLISSDALAGSHRYTVTMFDLKGKVVYRQNGTLAGSRQMSLQVPRHIRGTFIVNIQTDVVKLRRMVTIR